MEFKQKQAIYMQIAERLCEQIVLGKWPIGEKIPSVREMAIEAEVNPNTIVRTYAYLEEQGIILMRRGIGYFVTERAIAQITEIKREQFFSEHLPGLFHQMRLLNIDIAEIEARYKVEKRNEKK